VLVRLSAAGSRRRRCRLSRRGPASGSAAGSRDTARANYDQAWLDYQHEIGRRRTRAGKNRTDRVRAADHIPLRYVLALLVPITTTLKPFLAAEGTSGEDVEAMHQAWVKAVLLQVNLWSHP
jgi:Protoglobin